jgi:hypothetical protein
MDSGRAQRAAQLKGENVVNYIVVFSDSRDRGMSGWPAEAYGPFDTQDEARAWADSHDDGSGYVVYLLYKPDETDG